MCCWLINKALGLPGQLAEHRAKAGLAGRQPVPTAHPPVDAGLGAGPRHRVSSRGLDEAQWPCCRLPEALLLSCSPPQWGTAHPLLPGGYRALAKAPLRVVGTPSVLIAHHRHPHRHPKQPHSQVPFPTDPVLTARALPASPKGNLRAQHLYGTLGAGANEPDTAGASCAHKCSDPSSGRG